MNNEILKSNRFRGFVNQNPNYISDTLHIEFIDQILKELKNQGISEKEFADKLKMSIEFVEAIMKGTHPISLDLISQISVVLGKLPKLTLE